MELEIFPNAAEHEFKEKFIERYSKLTDWEVFKRYCLSFLRKSIRVNTLKISVEEVKKRLEKDWKLTPVPWCKDGFWIKGDRRDIGNLPEHSLGYIYVQEAASMIPPVVLDPQPGEKILDVAAAPGSKTTQLAQYMKNTGVLVANDVAHDRLASLGVNIQRCGVANEILTMMKGQKIRDIEFDRILLDAPCSGTGTIRKSVKTIYTWNPDIPGKMAAEQRQLINHAFSLLKKGGTMVYSTCSLEPEENEGVIDWFLEKHPDAKIIPIELDIKRAEPVTEFEGKRYNPEVKKCLRIWPQDNDTEGFFVVKIRKE